jgi:hypothetical protein
LGAAVSLLQVVSGHVSFEVSFRNKLCRTLSAAKLPYAGVPRQMLAQIAASIEGLATLGAEIFLKL